MLPTGGTARYSGGLSVHSFLRVRTWMRLDAAASELRPVIDDTRAFARLEGILQIYTINNNKQIVKLQIHKKNNKRMLPSWIIDRLLMTRVRLRALEGMLQL